MSIGKWRQERAVSTGLPPVCWGTFPCKNHESRVQDDGVIFIVLVLGIGVFLFCNMSLRVLISTVTVFKNKGLSDKTCKSVVQFLVWLCKVLENRKT